MSERVWLEDDIICQRAGENGLNAVELKEDLVKILGLQAELQKRKIPVCLLFDATESSSADTGIRKQAIQNVNSMNYERMAVFGIQSAALKYIANFVITGMGKKNKIRIFDTKEEAVSWLKGK